MQEEGKMKESKPAKYECTLKQQTAIEVTVYNEDMGLIKDQREVKIPKGLIKFDLIDIAKQIEAPSVFCRSITAPEKFVILEQNCEYESIEPERLLNKYEGKEVRIYRKNSENDKIEPVPATILYNGKDGLLCQVGDEIIFSGLTQIIFPNVSENIVAKPAITWLLQNDYSSLQTIETIYLARGLSWSADYHMVLNPEENKADIFAWATIDNNSGIDFTNAKLKLVAADVNLSSSQDAADYCRSPESQFEEESFADSHSYFLGRQTTLRNGEKKQMGLLQAGNVNVRKEYRLSGGGLRHIVNGIDVSGHEDVTIHYSINNNKSCGLGQPLPKGTVHAYKKCGNGDLQFIGRDNIGHLPVNESTTVKLGASFDIKATRIQKDFKKLSGEYYEATFDINIRNHKQEGAMIRIMEPIDSQWEIVESSHKFARVNSDWVECALSVESDKEITLTYRIRSAEE